MLLLCPVSKNNTKTLRCRPFAFHLERFFFLSAGHTALRERAQCFYRLPKWYSTIIILFIQLFHWKRKRVSTCSLLEGCFKTNERLYPVTARFSTEWLFLQTCFPFFQRLRDHFVDVPELSDYSYLPEHTSTWPRRHCILLYNFWTWRVDCDAVFPKLVNNRTDIGMLYIEFGRHVPCKSILLNIELNHLFRIPVPSLYRQDSRQSIATSD